MNSNWLGEAPKKCEVCTLPIGTKFYDAKIANGPWGLVCPACHQMCGHGLGIGRAQEYTRKGEDWVCTAGMA